MQVDFNFDSHAKQARVRFINDADATEQKFTLRGLARKLVAKKTLTYSCRVGDTIERAVRVENIAKWKLVYRVQSDLPFLSGPEHCTVFSGASADYKFSLAPLYHGTFKGVLRFVATRDPFVYVHLFFFFFLLLPLIFVSSATCCCLLT